MAAMQEGFFEGVRLKDKLIGWSIIAVPFFALLALGFVFLRPNPIAPEAVMGCYVAEGSPSLDVQRGSIRIGEPERRTFSYIAEPNKIGYRLTVAPAISLRPAGGGRYAFVQDRRGIGYFWNLLPKVSDDRQKMRVPEDYGGRFQIIATDGIAVIYSRTDRTEACLDTKSGS